MRHRNTPLLVLLFIGLLLESPIIECEEINLLNFDTSRTVYVDGSGSTHVNWLNDQHTAFRCIFTENRPEYGCGIDISLGDGRQRGLDFHEFDQLEVVLNYQGETDLLRFASRQALAGYESEPFGVRWDYNITLHPGRNEFKIPLREFIVPPWWLASNPMPADLLTPKWKNVVHVGFEIPSKSEPGEHIIEIESFSVNSSSRLPVELIVAVSGCLVLALAGLALTYQRKRNLHPDDKEQSCRESFLKCLENIDDQQQLRPDIGGSMSYDSSTLLLTRNAALSLLDTFSREQSPVGIGIALFEVDNLDAICTVHGEELRYEIHARIGAFLNVNTQPYEMVIAWTEDSYALVSPDTGLDKTKKIAAKICQQIKQLTFIDASLRISLSAGIANVAEGETIMEAFGRAENALLRAQDKDGDTLYALDNDNGRS